jgi:hypothetical protein
VESGQAETLSNPVSQVSPRSVIETETRPTSSFTETVPTSVTAQSSEAKQSVTPIRYSGRKTYVARHRLNDIQANTQHPTRRVFPRHQVLQSVWSPTARTSRRAFELFSTNRLR